MNKTHLIDAIAVKAGITKAGAKAALDSFINEVTNALKEGDRVTLGGFGTFAIIKRSPRKGRNPKTQQVMEIPEKKVVKFKAATSFSDELK
jgi:DNA-binding protein HU-beta